MNRPPHPASREPRATCGFTGVFLALALAIGAWILPPGAPAANSDTRFAYAAAAARATAVVAARRNSAYESVTLHGYEAMIFSISLNGLQRPGTEIFLRDAEGRLYAPVHALSELGLRVPEVAVLDYEDTHYAALDEIPGLRWTLDPAHSRIALSAPADAFTANRMQRQTRNNPTPTRAAFGGFFNYSLYGTRFESDNSLSALLDLGLFTRLGTASSAFVYRDTPSATGLVRLDSVWRHDNLDAMTSLLIGDTITRPGFLGGSVRIGGVQYGTNFATQPYLITFPLPTFAGSTALPSTVDVYVNNMLQSSSQVPAGPFTVPQVPVVTGQGEVRLVIRDILGRQTVITRPFFAASRLLRPGLSDYGFAAGWLRESFGEESFNYGSFVATGLWRHGVSDGFTFATHTEITRDLHNLGVGGVWLVDATGVFEAGLAASHGPLGNGVLGKFAFSQQLGNFSWGGSLALASPAYSQLGYAEDLPAPRQQTTANMGLAMGYAGSLSLTYVHLEQQDGVRTELLSAGYSRNLGPGFLNLTAYRMLGGDEDYGLQLGFTFSFGTRSSASLGLIRNNSATHAYVNLQRNLPPGNGFGYRLYGETGASASNRAEFDLRGSAGTYRLGIVQSEGTTGYFAEASGGAVFLDGELYATRQVNGSFALVELPGFPGVRVYRANLPIGRTDEEGELLVTDLLAYQHNKIGISPADLPLGTALTETQHDVVPWYRSGVVIRFPIEKTRAATFTVLLDGGKPLPAGATISIVGKSQTFPVGFDGLAYVTGLAIGSNRFVAHWKEQVCTFTLTLSADAPPQPDLGTVRCHGIKP